MNYKFSVEKTLWIMAALAVLAGFLLTLRSISIFGQQRDWIESKYEELARLESIGASFSELQAGLQTLAQMDGDKLDRLEGALKSAGMDSGGQVSYGVAEDIQNGWRIQKATVVWEQVDAVGLLGAIARLEQLRPPWRVTGCSMQSMPEGSGMVRASLTLEGIER